MSLLTKQLALLLCGFATLCLIGCGSDDSEEESAGTEETKPSYEECVAEFRTSYDAINTAGVEGDIHGAHGALHKAPAQLKALEEAAEAEGLEGEALTSVQEAITELKEIVGDLDALAHNHAGGKSYDEVADHLRHAMAVIESKGESSDEGEDHTTDSHEEDE